MGYGLSRGAGAGADMLREIIREKLFEQVQRHQMAMAEEARALQARGQDLVARGQDQAQKRFDLERADKIADVERDTAAKTAADTERKTIIGRLVTQNPQLARLIDARSLGFNINDPHAVETEQEHAPHLESGRKQELADFEEKERIKAKHNPPTPREERLVQIEGPDGRATWVRESQAVGQTAAQAARAVTGQERGVLAYYNRAKDAEDTINMADKSGRSLEDRVSASGLSGQIGLQYAPNMLQSSDQQAYRQAQRAFTEARLRKESGAAIPTAEYENDSKTYFAQPGDSPQTIQQKRQKRQTVLEGLKFSSGRAYDEFYGEPNKQNGASPAKADPLGLR